MSSGRKTNRDKQPEQFRHITLWEVLYRHLAKVTGILAALILGSITLLRCAPEDIPKVAATIFTSNLFNWIGWIIATIVLLTTIVFLRYDHNIKARELDRVCKERDLLQEKLLQRAITHSGNRNKP